MALRGVADRLRAAWRGHAARQEALLAELERLREDSAALRAIAAGGSEERRALTTEVARCREAIAARPAPRDHAGLLRDAALALVAATDPRRDDPLALRRRESQFYSQNGEDGAVAEIFRRIGARDRFFVEIGVEDGTQNNTQLLLEQGWRGAWANARVRALAGAVQLFCFGGAIGLRRRVFSSPAPRGRRAPSA